MDEKMVDYQFGNVVEFCGNNYIVSEFFPNNVIQNDYSMRLIGLDEENDCIITERSKVKFISECVAGFYK